MAQTNQVSVSMGMAYANDVFYSYKNGVVAEVPRAGWDLGFTTKSFDFNIITNDASNIKLWSYPKTNASGWDNVDTSGIKTWPLIYNNDSAWGEGAFTRGALAHPDYGWGVYSDNDHNVYGDSIYIIQTFNPNGVPIYKKLMIVKLATSTRIFSIKYANLDNTELVEVDIKAGEYDTKNFVYYSLTSGNVIDREPVAADWDIVFTRWISSYYLVNNGAEQKITGVFTNPALNSGKQSGIAANDVPCFFSAQMKPDYRNIIGGDWKSFNMNTMSYDIKTDLAYFTQAESGDTYSIRFTGFSGSTAGNITFDLTMVTAPAPGSFTTYDMTNFFGWTDPLPNLEPTMYEYSTNGGTNWMAVTSNPQQIDNAEYAAGTIAVRLKENTEKCVVTGSSLVSPIAFTANTGTTMSKGYANDVYVSAANGVVKEVVRSGWDIAFTTKSFDSNIFINDANGTKIWVYPKGKIADWGNVDTTGFYAWKVIYNLDSSWNVGAFTATALVHPDYGWGVYSDVNHNVYGDSLYIIRLEDGPNAVYKKLAIVELNSVSRIFTFKYANLDGSDEITVALNVKDYEAKNYVYYSLRGNKILDREPAKTEWDFVFTRWVSSFYWTNNNMEQKITGVYTKMGVEVGVQKGLTSPEQACLLSAEWKPDYRNMIGGDWKSFNINTFAYEIKTDLAYFFKTEDLSIYQMKFNSFAGTTTGNIGYELVKIDRLPTPAGDAYDDVANTFGWTFVSGYETPSAYTISLDGGTTWNAATANPMNIGDIDLAAGKIQIALPNDVQNCKLASDTLVSAKAYTKGTVGLARSEMPNLNIFPVPAKETLHITGLPVQSTIILFNVLGVKVYESVSNSEIQIPVNQLSDGIYMLRIKNKLGVFDEKIMINK